MGRIGSRLSAGFVALLSCCVLASLPACSQKTDEPAPAEAAAPPAAPDMAFERLPSPSPAVLPAAFADVPAPLSAQLDFKPNCVSQGCKIWAGYRAQRPFPLQTLAYAKSGDRGVLLITEPNMARPALEAELKDLFGSGVEVEAQRWLIGADGWLGDMVVTLPASATPSGSDPLTDSAFKDRVSLLAEDLWGTSFGLYVDDARSPWRPAALAAAPKLEVNAAEIQAWLLDASVQWQDPSGGAPSAFQSLVDSGAVGTFVSSTGDLAVFLISGEAIAANSLEGQRADFRRFAILSDAIVGAFWNSSTGSLALVGRARQAAPTVLAPLRFETVQLLASQRADNLSQSYERTTPLAGKLFSGLYARRDWAPIYLSYDLIDTEYGALLNITDQMLKSWSEAGTIQYLYFNYPLRPAVGRFVFGARPISDILHEKTGGTRTLFNWNTSGGAAIVESGGWSALSPTKASALPITYGSELSAGSGMKMGEVTQDYEDKAYAFYSGLGDPNLARVVAYATIYQAFRANPRAPHGSSNDVGPRTPAGKLVQARAMAGYAKLSEEVAKALAGIQSGQISPGAVDRFLEMETAQLQDASAEDRKFVADMLRGDVNKAMAERIKKAQETIAQFKMANPAYASDAELARLLVDRGRIPALYAQHEAKVDAFNSDVQRFNADNSTSSESELNRREAEITREGDSLEQVSEGLERLQSALSGTIALTSDIDATRKAFLQAHAQPGVGWIRTPSIVLSWSTTNVDAVGGHNLDARVLRIEPEFGLKAPQVVEGPTGPVLKVPPESESAARANANQLARMVEHGRVDQAELTRRLASFAPSGPLRTAKAALGITRPATGATKTLPQIRGGVLADQTPQALHAAARQQFGQSRMVAIRTNDGGISVSFYRAGKADCCVRMDDFASFRRVAQREVNAGGDIVLQGFGDGQAKALQTALSTNDRAAIAEALGGGGGRGKPPGDNTHFISSGGDGPRGPGNSGAGGGTPREPTNVALAFEGENHPALIIAAKRPRTFTGVSEADSAVASDIARKAGLTATDAPTYRISFTETGAASPSEIYAIADVAPGALREEAAGVAQRALTGAQKSQTVLDLAAEAKRIVARDPKRSSLRKLIIWVKESSGSFSLTEVDLSPQRNG